MQFELKNTHIKIRGVCYWQPTSKRPIAIRHTTLLSSTATNTQYHQTLTALLLKCLTLLALLLAYYKELSIFIETNLKWCNGKGNEQIHGAWEIYCVFAWFGFPHRIIIWLCYLLRTNGCFPGRSQLCRQAGMLTMLLCVGVSFFFFFKWSWKLLCWER